MLSIIIPTLNEEKHLPLLLESIKKQGFSNYEIIIADAGSKDKTIEIAKEYGCKIVPGGLPAKGRNEGAKIAKGDLFLFLDADMVLPFAFFEGFFKELDRRDLDIVSFPVTLRGKKFDKFAYGVYNQWARATQRFLPHAAQAVLVKKKVHQAIKGFDEEIKLAEDHAYARKAKKIAKYAFLKTGPVLTSARRFEQDGSLRTCLKFVFAEFYTIIFGPIKSDIFEYKFNHYKKEKQKTEK